MEMNKYLNYKEQLKRLMLALKNEFLLEAIFIEYSILEDRTDSLLSRCLGAEKALKRNKITPRINKMRALIGDKKYNINKYISLSLLDDTIEWINNRNSLMHALMKRNNSYDELKAIADTGYKLVKIFNSKSTSFKRNFEKHFLNM